MLHAVLWTVLLLAGGVAADTISEQDQIYIVAGVLAGVCFLLTVAAIAYALAVIKLQRQVAVLQAGAGGATKMVEPPRQQQQHQQAGPSKGEELNRYGAPHHEDPYRAPPRENYRMDRPPPPPRPPRGGPSARDNYY